MKEKRTISGQNGQVFGHACLLNIATNDVIKFTKNSSFRLMTTPRSCKGQLGPAHEGFYLFIYLFFWFAQLLHYQPSPSYISPFLKSLSISLFLLLSLKSNREKISHGWKSETWVSSRWYAHHITINMSILYMCDICHMKN